MNPLLYEQIMSLLGLIALWAFWFWLWKPQLIDIFRQELFALRSDLFDVAASGAVPFDHPAYAQLRLLINGMIRFAHRASLATLIVAARHSREAPSGALEAWKRSVQDLPEDARNQLLAVHAGVSGAFARHLAAGSVTISTYIVLRISVAVVRAVFLLLIGKKDLSYFTVSLARNKVDWERSQVAKVGGDAIEASVLNEEERRTGTRRQPAYAH